MRRIGVPVWVATTAVVVGCGGLPAEDIGSAATAVVGPGAIRAYTNTSSRETFLYTFASNNKVAACDRGPGGCLTTVSVSSASTSCPSWGYVRSDGIEAVAYIDTAGHVHESTRSSTVWSDIDFATSSSINAPLAFTGGSGCEIVGYVRGDGINAMVYRGANNHIYEVASNFSGSPPWKTRDLTADAVGALLVGRESAIAFRRNDSKSAVAYIATDNHVHQLVSNFPPSGAWFDRDLSVESGDIGSPATGVWAYRHGSFSNIFVFVGAEATPLIHQISYDGISTCNGSSFCKSILPATGTVLVARPSAYDTGSARQAVVYSSSNSNGTRTILRQLTLQTGGWTDEPLPATGGANAFPMNPFGHAAPDGTTSVVHLDFVVAVPFQDFFVQLFRRPGETTWNTFVF